MHHVVPAHAGWLVVIPDKSKKVQHLPASASSISPRPDGWQPKNNFRINHTSEAVLWARRCSKWNHFAFFKGQWENCCRFSSQPDPILRVVWCFWFVRPRGTIIHIEEGGWFLRPISDGTPKMNSLSLLFCFEIERFIFAVYSRHHRWSMVFISLF